MTIRLYQPNSFAQTFTAQVIQTFLQDGNPAVVLNQTAFYPGVGGQPTDAGTLNGIAVTDVFEREDGEIAHVLAAPLAHAEVPIDVIGNSEVSFEGLVQVDSYRFDVDTIDYGADTASDQDGKERLQELRRAELVLKGKGPGNFEWVLGYDAKDDKFLDANVKYKFGNNANHYLQIGQFKQSFGMDTLGSSNATWLMERSYSDIWTPDRHVGIAFQKWGERWQAKASFFGQAINDTADMTDGTCADLGCTNGANEGSIYVPLPNVTWLVVLRVVSSR